MNTIRWAARQYIAILAQFLLLVLSLLPLSAKAVLEHPLKQNLDTLLSYTDQAETIRYRLQWITPELAESMAAAIQNSNWDHYIFRQDQSYNILLRALQLDYISFPDFFDAHLHLHLQTLSQLSIREDFPARGRLHGSVNRIDLTRPEHRQLKNTLSELIKNKISAEMTVCFEQAIRGFYNKEKAAYVDIITLDDSDILIYNRVPDGLAHASQRPEREQVLIPFPNSNYAIALPFQA